MLLWHLQLSCWLFSSYRLCLCCRKNSLITA
ncbi:hypothetical protein FEF09_28315 [Chitinophaga pinensis]|uniref:Uncharacterized protein n=1 Tax=Chitinophaga pinensis TaxID=79329 RepID=A0A5C6LP06_9BACT|nr:hypothetical protein FEF09_28315 [Chitinophaga pinensis]